MKNGLIVTKKEAVLSINKAATQLFEVKREECVGHDIITVSRNEALIAVIEAVFSGKGKEKTAKIRESLPYFWQSGI